MGRGYQFSGHVYTLFSESALYAAKFWSAKQCVDLSAALSLRLVLYISLNGPGLFPLLHHLISFYRFSPHPFKRKIFEAVEDVSFIVNSSLSQIKATATCQVSAPITILHPTHYHDVFVDTYQASFLDCSDLLRTNPSHSAPFVALNLLQVQYRISLMGKYPGSQIDQCPQLFSPTMLGKKTHHQRIKRHKERAHMIKLLREVFLPEQQSAHLVFVSLDYEFFAGNSQNIREIGISTLATRDAES